MTDRRRVRVYADIYRNALADAIAWTESILATHDPQTRDMGSCCKPGARCDDYQMEAERWRRYKRAYAAVARPQPPEPPARMITLAELAANPAPSGTVPGAPDDMRRDQWTPGSS